MPYKQTLVIVIILLFLSALAVAYRFLPNSSLQTNSQPVDYTNRIHTNLYRDAQATWDAQLKSESLDSSSRLRLTWNKPEETYNHFLITVTAADYDAPWTRTESGEHDRVSLDLSELLLDTDFIFVVQACLNLDCTEWLIADQEAGNRTEKEIWSVVGIYTTYPQGKLIPYTFDLTETIRREEWESDMTPRLDIEWPTKLIFPADAKQTLGILENFKDDKTSKQHLIIEQTLNGKKIVYGATLKNP